MIIDASQADRTDGPYLPRTVRLALWDGVSDLKPHQSISIERAIGPDGMTTVDGKVLQVIAATILREKPWLFFTRRSGDSLTIYRWS